MAFVVPAVFVLPLYFFFEQDDESRRLYTDMIMLMLAWPMLAVQVRRWHDRNKSAWWVLMNFVPFVGFFWVIIENGFLKGVDENNNY